MATCCPDECPVAKAPRRLPLALLDRHLGDLVVEDIRPKRRPPQGLAVIKRQGQDQGRASVVVPHLNSVHAMINGISIAALEEVVDSRAGGAVQAGDTIGVLEALNVVALLLVGDEV